MQYRKHERQVVSFINKNRIHHMKIALAQINSITELEGNINKMISFVQRAKESKADLWFFGIGIDRQPLHDLSRRPDFVQHAGGLRSISCHTAGTGVLWEYRFPFKYNQGKKRCINGKWKLSNS